MVTILFFNTLKKDSPVLEGVDHLFWRPKNPPKAPVKPRALARGRALSADFYDSEADICT